MGFGWTPTTNLRFGIEGKFLVSERAQLGLLLIDVVSVYVLWENIFIFTDLVGT